MSKYNKTKSEQIGMPIGTASARLKKNIMFDLLCRLNENKCYQCGEIIENAENLSVEHKIPYLHSENPQELFFNLDNIAFSHLKCNIGAARKNIKTLSLSQIEKCKLGNHSKSDLNEEKVKEIREYLKTNRQRDAVKEFNISRFVISRIVTGKSFSYIE